MSQCYCSSTVKRIEFPGYTEINIKIGGSFYFNFTTDAYKIRLGMIIHLTEPVIRRFVLAEAVNPDLRKLIVIASCPGPFFTYNIVINDFAVFIINVYKCIFTLSIKKYRLAVQVFLKVLMFVRSYMVRRNICKYCIVKNYAGSPVKLYSLT